MIKMFINSKSVFADKRAFYVTAYTIVLSVAAITIGMLGFAFGWWAEIYGP